MDIERNGKIVVTTYEEKETDVNLGIYLVKGALKKEYNHAIIVTNDTDLVPAIKMALNENPNITISILTPPKYTTHYTFTNLGTTYNKDGLTRLRFGKITERHIAKSILPERIKLENGKFLNIPNEYK